MPGGLLLFIEYLRSADPRHGPPAGPVELLNRLVVCRDCNRPTLDSSQVSFTVTQQDDTALPKTPKFVSPAIIGTATGPTAGCEIETQGLACGTSTVWAPIRSAIARWAGGGIIRSSPATRCQVGLVRQASRDTVPLRAFGRTREAAEIWRRS